MEVQMKGSVQVKNGKWYVVLSYKDTFGKPTHKWINTNLAEKGNKKKAKEILNKTIIEYENKEILLTPVEPEKKKQILFVDFFSTWFKETKDTIEENTYHSYEYYVNKTINYFEDKNIMLDELKPFHLIEFYNTLYKRGLTGNTVMHYHVIIRKCLQQAFKLDLVNKNIADMVDRPKKAKYEATFYNRDELNNLLDLIKGDALELIVNIAAFYGLRKSEILGLKWSNIDYENKVIKVKHKVVFVKSQVIAKDKMKNESSSRTLPLIPQIEAMLIKEKGKQERNQKLCGKKYNKQYLDYVCVDGLGKIIRADFVSEHFNHFLKKHNLKHIRFHDLRHSCASLMLANGVQMKEIQEWLGHSSFEQTANTYSHLDFSSKINSANKISSVLKVDNNTYQENEKDLDTEILELERLLEEKKKQKRNRDFEM